MAEDWASFSEPTPGAANKESEIGGGSSSSGSGSDKPSSPGSGCSTGGIAPAWLAFSLLIYSRRRTH